MRGPHSSTAKPGGAELPNYFGDYQILGELARGGMGIVYRARQVSLNRLVALKVAQLPNPSQIQRFRIEAEAAARLDHPNIVPIYEVGEHHGQHFYSMKLIDGGTVADGPLFLQGDLHEQSRNSVANVARENAIALCIAKVARAVQYAHQRGVLHRDLKPSNILLDSAGEPLVSDFGLAKFSDEDSSLTQSGSVLGTPAYMAPELASGLASRATTAADVYSLGAVLYHMLFGRPPFEAETIPALLRKIVEEDPASPSVIAQGPRSLFAPRQASDLATISLKCLEKDPSRRYHSADALAEELERWLRGEPIRARPVSTVEHVWRWCRRRPAFAGLLSSLLLLLVVATAGALLAVHRINQARRSVGIAHQGALQANGELGIANQQLASTVSRLELRLAEDLFAADDVSGGLAWLGRVVRRDPSNHVAAERLLSALMHRNYALPAVPPIWQHGLVRHVEFNATGDRLLILRLDGIAQICDAITGTEILPNFNPFQTGPRSRVNAVAFSHDGKMFATGSGDQIARIWDARTGKPLASPLMHDGPVRLLKFSPDGARLLSTTGTRTLYIWSVTDGAKLFKAIAHSSRITSLDVSPDSQSFVTASEQGSARIHSFAAPSGTITNLTATSGVSFVQFSPDGRQLLAICGDSAVRVWDATSAAQIGEPLQHLDVIEAAEFSPDGKWIATASRDRTAQVWDAKSGRAFGAPLRHTDALTSLCFSPDSKLLASGSWDNSAHIWDLSGRRAFGPLRHMERVWSVSFSPDGKRIATGSTDGVVQIWDVRPGEAREIRMNPGSAVFFAALSPDGKKVATGSDRGVQIWNSSSGERIGPPLAHTGKVSHIAFSPDGKKLATIAGEKKAEIWSVDSGNFLFALPHEHEVVSVSFDDTSTRIVTTSHDFTARTWDALSGEPVIPPLRHEAWVKNATFSPDGKFLATAGYDSIARIWDARTGEPVSPKLLHAGQVEAVSFSPDGRRLATASHDNTARLWDVRKGVSLGRPMQHTRSVFALAFSPDGQRIATASWDRTARVWDAFTGAAVSESMVHLDQVWDIRFSHDGRRIATASLDGTARIWDPVTGRPLTEPLRHGKRVWSVEFSPDSQHLLTASSDGTARLWPVPTVPLTATPAWLADLAEAVGGLALDTQRNFKFTERGTLSDLQADAAQSTNDFFGQFRAWFFANRAIRERSPAAY